jgi:putative ABC transport system substrate-binding protein
MNRRAFISLLGGAAVARPLAAFAQQKTSFRIGVLLVEGAEVMGPYREALRELGYEEGRNLRIEIRSAQGQVDRLAALASELANSKVDIILASQTPAVIAAKDATREIPIVMAPAGDPLSLGLVASLARPGANITGLSSIGAEMAAKSLELVPTIVPGARRVTLLGNAGDPFVKPFLQELQNGARIVGLATQEIAVRGNDELAAAFAELARERPDFVVIQGSLPNHLTVQLSLQHRLPSLSTQKSAVQAGLLASNSASFAERGRQIAGYVDAILKGGKPADLPVQQPTKFEIAINLRTARALGLTIPPTLLALADEVIE